MAAEELGGKARWHLVDTAHQASIDAFFDQIEVLHGLFTTAATYVTGSIAALSVEQAATPFESKFWGQYRVVKSALPKLSSDASVVLMSGAASVRPAGSAPAYVAANAAIEGLARGLAHELAPIRVNALSWHRGRAPLESAPARDTSTGFRAHRRSRHPAPTGHGR